MTDTLPLSQWQQKYDDLRREYEMQSKSINTGRMNERRYQPWYNNHADYQTNSLSYYDYLAWRNFMFENLLDIINQLLRREIKVAETSSVKMNQNGNWETEDDITLSADAKVSQALQDGYTNAIKILDDGLYSKDFSQDIQNIKNDITTIYKLLQNRYSYIDDNALNLHYYNGWYPGNGGASIHASYVKAYGAVTFKLTFDYSQQNGINTGIYNDNLQQNVTGSGPKSLLDAPQAAIFGFDVNRDALPDEIKNLDIHNIYATGTQLMNSIACLPVPNTYPAIISFGDEKGYSGLSLNLRGMVNGYNNSKIGTSVMADKCIGFLGEASWTFGYNEN